MPLDNLGGHKIKEGRSGGVVWLMAVSPGLADVSVAPFKTSPSKCPHSHLTGPNVPSELDVKTLTED